MRENETKQMLDEGKLVAGVRIFTGSPIVVQMIGYSGFDFVFIDMGYTPVTIGRELQTLTTAANKSGMGIYVRAKHNDEVLIRTATEFGTDAIVIPHCRVAGDVRKVVQTARLPPYGVRGPVTDYRSTGCGCYPDFNFGEHVEKCNRGTLIVPPARDPEFFNDMDEILDMEGLGGVQLGSSDLTLGLGTKETYNFDNPQARNRSERLFKKAKEKGIPLMGPIVPPNLERAIETAGNEAGVTVLRNDIANFKMLLAGLRKDIYIPLKKHFKAA